MAVERLAKFARSGLQWGFSADILNCFDSIPQQPLLAGLKKTVTADVKVLLLIKRWIELAAGPGARSSRKGVGIPQGSVLSPFLCNVYLTTLDNGLAARRIRFVRFADNIFALAKSSEEAAAIGKKLAGELQRLGLKLNRTKTQIVRYGPGVRFLGLPLPRLGHVEKPWRRKNRW